MSKAPPGNSMAPGSPVPEAATATSSHAAGKQRDTGQFTIARFLEESTAMLDKIKHTAANVTTCQCQIDQVFDRAGSLLEALSVDSLSLDQRKLEEAGAAIEETLKDLHKHVLRFAIYGRPKAFVTRNEISAYFETFNVQIDSVLSKFAIAKHPDVVNWEGEYYQAKLDDEAASHEQLWDILRNPSDMKTIMEMGEQAMVNLKTACASTMDDPHTTADRKAMLKNALKNFDLHPPGDPTLMDPTKLFEKPKGFANARLNVASFLNRASSSSSNTGRSTPAYEAADPSSPVDPAETPAARAKGEEAERERAMASGEYEDPALPRWEPRRPPPGRGPGSIGGSTDLAKNLSALAMSEEQVQAQPPPPPGGWEGQGGVPDDLPPSYS